MFVWQVGPIESGVLDSRCGRGCVPFMEGRNTLTHRYCAYVNCITITFLPNSGDNVRAAFFCSLYSCYFCIFCELEIQAFGFVFILEKAYICLNLNNLTIFVLYSSFYSISPQPRSEGSFGGRPSEKLFPTTSRRRCQDF